MEKLYWVWIAEALGYCSCAANAVVSEVKNPKKLYGKSKNELLKYGIFSPTDIKNIMKTPITKAEEIIMHCEERGYSIITVDDEEYPDRLRNIPMLPLVLYVKGQLGDIDNIPAIAMVGARNASEYGAKVALKLGHDLAKCGFTVISGLAIGIDAFSLRGALKGGGRTIAVLGAGLDSTYPNENKELRAVIENNGAVVTEYSPRVTPSPQNFPARNRIMSGLSLGVLVVEASARSGSLITAGHALTQGKDVFAVPNDIFDPLGAGTIRLLKEGAAVVSRVDDIVEEYYWEYSDKINYEYAKEKNNIEILGKKDKNTQLSEKDSFPKTSTEHTIKQKIDKAPEYLTQEQLLVFSLLSSEEIGVDKLLEKSGLTMYTLLSVLTELEIYGLAKPLPGKRFVR